MEITGNGSRLRLVMIADDGRRQERVFPKYNPNIDLVDAIADRPKSIVKSFDRFSLWQKEQRTQKTKEE
jgi:hypothetical protein